MTNINKLSSHNYGGWKTQFDRMHRWYSRMQEFNSDSDNKKISPEGEDTVYAFFQNCYHLRDWIQKEHPTLQNDLNKLFEAEELKLCRDVCNGTKHMKYDKHHIPSIDRNFYTFREYDYLATADESHLKFNIRAKGQKYDLYETAEKCIKMWDGFIKKNKELRLT